MASAEQVQFLQQLLGMQRLTRDTNLSTLAIIAIKLGEEVINARGERVGGSLVQESPVAYRNIGGRMTRRIYPNLRGTRAAQVASIHGGPSLTWTVLPTQL